MSPRRHRCHRVQLNTPACFYVMSACKHAATIITPHMALLCPEDLTHQKKNPNYELTCKWVLQTASLRGLQDVGGEVTLIAAQTAPHTNTHRPTGWCNSSAPTRKEQTALSPELVVATATLRLSQIWVRHVTKRRNQRRHVLHAAKFVFNAHNWNWMLKQINQIRKPWSCSFSFMDFLSNIFMLCSHIQVLLFYSW